MIPTPEGIVASLQSDARVAEFPVLCSLPTTKKILDTMPFRLRTRVSLEPVIDLGEHWLREILWSEHLAVLENPEFSERQKSSASEPLLLRLASVEQRARALRRCLYDADWSKTFLKGLFVKGGEAWRLYDSNGLSIGELLHYEPAVFILAVTSVRNQLT